MKKSNHLYVLVITLCIASCEVSSDSAEYFKRFQGNWQGVRAEGADSINILADIVYKKAAGMHRMDIKRFEITDVDTFGLGTDFIWYDQGKVIYNGTPYYTDSLSKDSTQVVWSFFLNEQEADFMNVEKYGSAFLLYLKNDLLFIRSEKFTEVCRRID